MLYLGGLRAAEVTGTAMGAFFCRRDAQGIERWWLEVTGKGNKTRLVPATDELIAELARYRRTHGLAPNPQPGKTRPLLLPVIGQENREKGLSRGALHLILKKVFGLAAARLRARARMGSTGRGAGQCLGPLAAPTAGSHMTDQQVDLRYVRDNFGHSSISTTSGYLHSEEDARHEATQARHRIDWTSKTSGATLAPGNSRVEARSAPLGVPWSPRARRWRPTPQANSRGARSLGVTELGAPATRRQPENCYSARIFASAHDLGR